MENAVTVLRERGFVEQTTHETELDAYIEGGKTTCYIGFDPTASSLHVGHLIPIMALSHMQRAGHQPIALVGGGTGMVGDPSGKTEMRKMLTLEMIQKNANGIKCQLSRFLDFGEGKALLLNNADWLSKLEYIPFLRDVGRYFSVNRMIKAESYKMRLDSDEGLSFIEFNYMVLQAYDFLVLSDAYGCQLQMGGSDQWGNIVAGIDLIRRMRQRQAFGLTFKLITTSSGAKMGKTAEGAVWLDPERTSPYEYYQYWINSDDRDVVRFLSLFTFLPLEEIQGVDNLVEAQLNSAKAVLAFEATALAHGRDAAIEAHKAAASVFGARQVSQGLLPSSAVPRGAEGDSDALLPSSSLKRSRLEVGVPIFRIFLEAGLATSGSAARRLISQGGGYINGRRIDSAEEMLSEKEIDKGQILLRAGKKRFHKLIIEN
jgi:tyrosyl-tRNA synthetase